jgi:hypothetical protein
MRTYWMRILFGALAIFAIGMVGVTLFRHGRDKVTEVVTGSGPLNIPLALVPFQLNGSKLGTLERLVINRVAPTKLSSVHVEVKLEDSLLAQGLAGCRLAANVEDDSTSPRHDINLRAGRMGEHTFFFCAASDSGLVDFGTVTFRPGEVTVPLLVPQTLAQKLQSGEWTHDQDSTSAADAIAERAESLADQAEARADSVAQLESRREAVRLVRSRLGDSLRAEGKRRADSLHQALSRMADSLQRN